MTYHLRYPTIKNVLFIIPSLSEKYPNSVEDANDVDVIHPSLGILYISSYAKKFGYNSIVLDDLVKRNCDGYEEMEQTIKDEKISIVFITCMTANFTIAVQYAMRAKAAGCIVVLGGPHASCIYSSDTSLPYIDILSIGEGERVTVELLDALYSRSDVRNVSGIAFHEEGRRIVTKKSKRISDLGIDMSPYVKTQSLGMISSRGCPNNCLFCSSRCIWGRKVTYRSPDNIIKEMDFLCDRYNYAGKELLFYDDNITLEKSRLDILCSLMVERDYNFKWKCMSRIDTITPRMLESMKRAGCYSISFGVESVNERSLKLMNKNTDLKKIEKAIKMCCDMGIIFHGYFMIGFPWENKKDFFDTVSFICDHNEIEASLSVLTPYPGTDFYANKDKWGIEIDEEWDKYNHISSAIKSDHFTNDDIYAAFSMYLLNEERKAQK